ERGTKNCLCTFSTDVTSAQKAVTQGEYQLNKRSSVNATRNATGGVAFDGKVHTVFLTPQCRQIKTICGCFAMLARRYREALCCATCTPHCAGFLATHKIGNSTTTPSLKLENWNRRSPTVILNRQRASLTLLMR